MAEGDTILRAGRQIEAALAGQTVAVTTPNPRGRAAGLGRLDGRRLEAVRTHGKNLLLDFGDLALHSHLGMSGSWHVYGTGESWRKPARSAWAVLAGEHHRAVQFGGPTLRVAPAAVAGRELARLGPDILAPDLDLDATVASLGRAAGRPVGEALLDQSLVAGIGNIFKSEACFEAGVDPWERVDELSEAELEALFGAARRLMLESVEHGRPRPAVYKRSGRPCPRCGAQIESRGQGDANRTTYWCPSCQAG